MVLLRVLFSRVVLLADSCRVYLVNFSIFDYLGGIFNNFHNFDAISRSWGGEEMPLLPTRCKLMAVEKSKKIKVLVRFDFANSATRKEGGKDRSNKKVPPFYPRKKLERGYFRNIN